MPTSTETKQLVGGLRPAIKQGAGELHSAIGTLKRMAATLDALDSLNGDILAAPTDEALAAALLAARQKLREVDGYVYNVEVPVYDENGDPVLDIDGEPVTATEERVVPSFLDAAATLRTRLAALDSPELRAGIAAARQAAEQ